MRLLEIIRQVRRHFEESGRLPSEGPLSHRIG
jgi:hypothetical protein